MAGLADDLGRIAEHSGFSGVVRVAVRGETVFELAQGDADRANGRPITAQTRFATASGTKGLTALTVLSLAETGDLRLDDPVRAIVGDRLPNIDAAVTIDQLLTHRSGIGDYLDESELDDIDDHLLGDRSAHLFEVPSDYLQVLETPPQRDVPGSVFRYNNSGYMVLALVIELVAGAFGPAVEERVLHPAGMQRSGFFRSDDLPADVGLGYLTDGRTNLFHLPVVGGGDGGAYVTLDDLDALWTALLAGRIVSPRWVDVFAEDVSRCNDDRSHGRGVWLRPGGDELWLEGHDAGVSFISGRRRSGGLEYSVLSNTSDGAWPLARRIAEEA